MVSWLWFRLLTLDPSLPLDRLHSVAMLLFSFGSFADKHFVFTLSGRLRCINRRQSLNVCLHLVGIGVVVGVVRCIQGIRQAIQRFQSLTFDAALQFFLHFTHIGLVGCLFRTGVASRQRATFTRKHVSVLATVEVVVTAHRFHSPFVVTGTVVSFRASRPQNLHRRSCP